ncbi:MAG: hypothetical protein Q7R76_00100 [Candidatus Woesearchaeota archaeon]|nr:hypothetical protein [Candidatus Woesearchaeota archaeon]
MTYVPQQDAPESFCEGLEREVQRLGERIGNNIDQAVERTAWEAIDGAGDYVRSIFESFENYLEGRNDFDDD